MYVWEEYYIRIIARKDMNLKDIIYIHPETNLPHINIKWAQMCESITHVSQSLANIEGMRCCVIDYQGVCGVWYIASKIM